jgi:uncharacterized protein
MRIRSITCFIHPRWPLSELVLQKAGIFAQHAKQAFETAGYPVQTLRMATPSYAEFLVPEDYAHAASQIEVFSHSEGFEYVALGPALPHKPDSYRIIPELLGKSGNLFFSGHLTTDQSQISLPAVRACAEVIHRGKGWVCQPALCCFGKRAALGAVLPGSLSPGKSPSVCIGIGSG